VVTIRQTGYTAASDSRTGTVSVVDRKGDSVAVIDPKVGTVTVTKDGYAIVYPKAND